jgi:hypothetical protein
VALSEEATGAGSTIVDTQGFKLLVRDLARTGTAGAIAGVLIAGIGGRLVMRLAALAIPEAAGAFTSNDFRIGDITLGGSLGLIVVVGLLFGAFGAVLWVVVSPWIPGMGLPRAILAMPVAVALGGLTLVEGDNRDFFILQHSPGIVAMLIVLVALFGLALALLDDWLDRRLPAAGTESDARRFAYALLIGGGLLILPLVVGGFFDGQKFPIGLALVATGLATVAWWVQRARGLVRPTRWLLVTGRAALLAAVVLGTAVLVPEVKEALALS